MKGAKIVETFGMKIRKEGQKMKNIQKQPNFREKQEENQ